MSRPRLLTLAVAAGLVLLPVAGVGAEDEPGSGLDSYRLLANAPGLALDGLYRDVAVTVPEVTSSLRTGNVGSGFASLAWPGPVIGNGGSTMLVLQPSLPPETVLLNSPVRAEARTGGADKAADTTVPGTLMAATAEPDEATADASFHATSLPVGSVAGMSSSSRVALEGATKAVAESETVVQDLSLADGVVTLGSVRSTARAVSDGVKGTATGGTTVSGMEIAGVPVTVDGSGITVQDQEVPPLSAQAVNEAVEALGLQVVLTEPRTVVSGGNVSHQAGALVLVFAQGGDEYALTLGRASATIDAAQGSGDDGGAAPETPAAPAPPAVVPAAGGAAPEGPAVTDGGGTVPVPDVAPVTETGGAELPAAPALAAPPAAPLDGGGLATFVPVSFALSGGVPALLSLVALVAAALVAAGLRRLPDRVLALSTVECDERSSR